MYTNRLIIQSSVGVRRWEPAFKSLAAGELKPDVITDNSKRDSHQVVLGQRVTTSRNTQVYVKPTGEHRETVTTQMETSGNCMFSLVKQQQVFPCYRKSSTV